MAILKLDAGVCGFHTTITAESSDGMTVEMSIESECPHIMKAADALKTIDAYAELFVKPCDTVSYKALAEHLPHVTCPMYSAFLKATEAAAGLALPKDVHMTFE